MVVAILAMGERRTLTDKGVREERIVKIISRSGGSYVAYFKNKNLSAEITRK